MMSLLADLTTIKMDLANVLYISYLVPLTRIRQYVPRMLAFASDAADRVYVSFVAMKCHRVRLSGLPWPQFNYDQLNLRTYVLDPQTGNPAVFFLQSGVSMGIVPVLTRLMGIPWEKIEFDLDSTSQPRYRVSGEWLGELNFEIESPVGVSPRESIVQHLTGPLMGFMGSENKLRSFRISHRVLKVQPAALRSIRFPLPVEKGLVTETELETPDNVFMVPKAEFNVHVPTSNPVRGVLHVDR
jgi:hypothetical protein